MESFLHLVKQWFLENKRVFPWRENPTPYRVWVSEVMLQQTIASVVVPYFDRWMERFPNVETLALAQESEVIKMWEGLGYYSRARNLHSGAKYIVDHFKGVIPGDDLSLQQIKGLGPYTRGAILSFAFHKKALAIDGNVIRLFCRYYGITEEIEKSSTKELIVKFVEQNLKDDEPWVISEAFIELGASICKKNPKCFTCPLKKGCASFRLNLQTVLPKKRLKPKITLLYRIVAIIEHEGELLLQQREKGEVMEGLFEFPYIEKKGPPSLHEAFEDVNDHFGKSLEYIKELEEEKHTFTRFRAYLFPFIFKTDRRWEGTWRKKSELLELPFSSGHRRILKKYENESHFTS